VARKMANDFFGHFAAVMAPEQPAPAAAELAQSEIAPLAPAAELEGVAAEPPLPSSLPRPAGIRLPPTVWVTALVVIIGLLLYFFTR